MPNSQPNILVTSVGVVLVLITLYFTTNALKRNYEYNQQKLEQELQQREQAQRERDLLQRQLIEKELLRQAHISFKFKEHQFHCYDLQIFIKSLPADEDQDDDEEEQDQTQEHQQTVEQSNSNQISPKRSIKRSHRKKELNKTHQQQQPKKTASTEPIIYLFVLVLLYLLLRAISDITQHYKEQSKGDKRNLRRCSLQVYAQMKNERRSSKGIARTYKNIFKYFKP